MYKHIQRDATVSWLLFQETQSRVLQLQYVIQTAVYAVMLLLMLGLVNARNMWSA
jgi:hypothetical protein